jgi:LysM repeat protein
MNTFKTAIVVVALLIVLYGVYTALNKPGGNSTAGSMAETPFQIEGGGSGAASDADKPDWANDPDAPFIPGGAGSSTLTEVQPPPIAVSELSGQQADPYANPAADFAGLQEYDPTAAGDLANEFNQTPPATNLGGSEVSASLSPTQDSLQQPQADAEYRRIAEQEFAAAWADTIQDLQSGNHRRALATLSFYYKSPYLTAEQNQELLDLLDPLAGKVIYSREHLLYPAYVVNGGDTLESIAAAHKIPVALLANINGISPGNQVPPGTELKVVRGPFSAEVDSEELTLFVGELYAGRFPVTLGNNPAPKPSAQPVVYQVRSKEVGKEFVAGTTVVPARHPENPYGDHWLDLGNGVGLHEQNPSSAAAQSGLGCIGLESQDAIDVANILSVGSEVRVR